MVAGVYFGRLCRRSFDGHHGGLDSHTAIHVVRDSSRITAASKYDVNFEKSGQERTMDEGIEEENPPPPLPPLKYTPSRSLCGNVILRRSSSCRQVLLAEKSFCLSVRSVSFRNRVRWILLHPTKTTNGSRNRK